MDENVTMTVILPISEGDVEQLKDLVFNEGQAFDWEFKTECGKEIQIIFEKEINGD